MAEHHRRRLRRVLVANRGEIARRVMRTCRTMGIATVAVYSDPDRLLPHVLEADTAIPLGGMTASESYLDVAKILEAAACSGADAVHPGYGFLAENPEFAEACVKAGLVWIGPTPQAIRSMALKVEAKEIMSASTVPMLPGATIDTDDADDWTRLAADVGYPLLVKASAGGGGKGMRRVDDEKALPDAVEGARREAQSSFGNPDVFIERCLVAPRHVEVQVFGDEHGNVVHLFERDCSLQRRHQKVVEEAPAPGLSTAVREGLHRAAVAAARAIDYTNAGTVEFLVDGEDFYFLEMNTRLQVEHPVTELICGLDLVRLQLDVAAGGRLPFEQDDITCSGHAIEVRLYAEDPTRDFLPSVGAIHRFDPGPSSAVRWDSGVESGSEVSPYYDPMLAKVIAHAPDRDEAALRLARALRRLEVHGVTTNRDSLVASLEHASFLDGAVHTAFFDEHPEVLTAAVPASVRRLHAVAAALALRERRHAASIAAGLAPPGWRNVPSAPTRDTFRFADTDESVEVAYAAAGRTGIAITIDGDAVGCRVVTAGPEHVDIELDGVRASCDVHAADGRWWVNTAEWQTELSLQPRFPEVSGGGSGHGPAAPVPGTVILVDVEVGQRVDAGDLLVVLEAMKMEHRIVADVAGTVTRVLVEPGESVEAHQLLVDIEPEDT